MKKTIIWVVLILVNTIFVSWTSYRDGRHDERMLHQAQECDKSGPTYPNSVYELGSGGYALVYDDGPVYFDSQRLRSCIMGSSDAHDEVCQKAKP